MVDSVRGSGQNKAEKLAAVRREVVILTELSEASQRKKKTLQVEHGKDPAWVSRESKGAGAKALGRSVSSMSEEYGDEDERRESVRRSHHCND